MPIPSDAFARARKLKPDAVATVLASVYGNVHRLAYGLAGRADVGRGIVRYVMARAVRLLPNWHDEAEAELWFHHFTVLTARRSHRNRPEPLKDLLVVGGDGYHRGAFTPAGDDPAYVAFVAALRALPHQQQEAFLLHHGEKLNTRFMSVSMDCSIEAAHNHLRVATGSLRMVAGPSFDAFTNRLAVAYARQTPSEDLVLPSVKSIVRRRVWPRRVGRWVRAVFVLALLAALIYAAWWLYPRLEY